MKIAGQNFTNDDAVYGPVVIRRGDKLHGFYAQPVWSYAPFHAAYPKPEPPVSAFGKGGKKKHDDKNPLYLEAMGKYGLAYWGFMALTSLKPSNLDFSDQGIDEDDPETWHKVEAAMRYDAETNPDGLSFYEFQQVMDLINEANGLDAAKLETNLESFLAEVARLEKPGEAIQNGEVENTPSGKLASDGA